MSELLKKYESIDQSKLNEATIKIINRVKSITADFTADDEKNNKIAEQVLNEVMKKNPDSVKIVKRTPKAKPAPKKVHKATHTAKGTHKTTSTAKTSNNIMSVTKEIQKAGESWKDAMERAKAVIKERKEKVVQKQKTELEKLYNLVKTKKELQGFANSDIRRDSVREAKKRGARFVTKEGNTSNKYGTFPNKLGRKYWETRDRHADRLAPNYPKNMPLLASGGAVSDAPFSVEVFKTKLRFDNELTSSSKGDFPTFAKAKEFAIDMIDNGNYYAYIFSKNGYLWGVDSKGVEQFADGGMMDNMSIHNSTDFFNTPVYANGGSVNMDKHVWEGWTVGSFIEELEPQFNQIMSGGSWQKPFKTKEEVKAWCMDNQPYYKKNIPEVVNYFWAKVQSKDDNGYYAKGGGVGKMSEWSVSITSEDGDTYDWDGFAKNEDEALYMAEQEAGFESVESGITEITDAEGNKIEYAYGGGVKKESAFRANNSPLLKYANFKDDSHINLLRFNPLKRDGTQYKSDYKFAVSTSTKENRQKVLKFKKLELAEKKFNDLVADRKKQFSLRNEGKTDNYANGGSLPFMTDPNFGNFQNTGAFADGGLTNSQEMTSFIKKLKNNSVVKEVSSEYGVSEEKLIKRLMPYVKVLKYNDGNIKEISIDFFDKFIDKTVKEKMTFNKFELGGAFMMTDLAGHTGGSDGLGNPTPLSGVSGTYYTGLVGETGAMSSGELFEDGGSVNKNFDLTGYKKYREFTNFEDAKDHVDNDRKKYPNAIESVIIKHKDKYGEVYQVWAMPLHNSKRGNRVYAIGGGVGDNVLGLKKGDIYKVIDTQHTAGNDIYTFIDYIDKDNKIALKSIPFPPNPKKKNDFIYVFDVSSDGIKVLNYEEIGQVISRKYKNFVQNNYEAGGGIEKKIYGIEKDGLPYDFSLNTYQEAKVKAEKYMNENPRIIFEPRLYNDMRSELPAIERMYMPILDENGNLYESDKTPFSQGDLDDYEAGGVMAQNQQVINDASQSYVNYYLGEGASQGIYKDGGSIPNNYEGRTPEDVWNNWTISQKEHFVSDHFAVLSLTNPQFSEWIEDFTKNAKDNDKYDSLAPILKSFLKDHISEGQYAKGGAIINQYKDRTPKDIWDSLTKQQRGHFIHDHIDEISYDKGVEELPAKDIIEGYNSDYKNLDFEIKFAFNKHVSIGQYAKGGGIPIPNNYEGRNAENIWRDLTQKQRQHFLDDHVQEIYFFEYNKNQGKTKLTVKKDLGDNFIIHYKDSNKLTNTDDFNKLPQLVKSEFRHHIKRGQYAYGGKTKSRPSMRELYIENIAYLTNTREVGVDAFAKEHNLTDSELSNLMTGLGRKMISQSDFITALVGNKNNPKQKEVVAFAKSDKAYKMADGGALKFKVGQGEKYFDKKEKMQLTIGKESDIPNVYNVIWEDGENSIYSDKNINFLISNGVWKKVDKMAYGGSVDDNFEEVIDLGSEQYYTRPFGVVESESKGEVELVVVATIKDLEDYMSEDELPEEGNFQLDITLVPTEEFISEEILESANDEDTSSISDDSVLNVVNYAGGLNYSPQERVFFESHQDALDYLMSEELKEQINRDTFSSDYIMYNQYNRAGQTNSDYLDYLMGVTDRFAKGGSVDDSVIDDLFNGYASAVLFTETDSDSGEPLDSEYSISDFDKETVTSTKKMLAEFYSKNKETIEESELDLDTIGNDIWYTRSGQGAGFFDHSLDAEVEEKLTKGAKALGEYPSVETYDGKISVRGGKVFAKGGGVSGARFKFDIGDKVMIDDRGYVTAFTEFDLSKPAEIIDRSTTKMGGKTYYFYKVKMADGRVAFNQAEQSKLTLVEKGSFAKGGFIGTVEFNVGDTVWQKDEKRYATVMNNYGDPINGDYGELRLDTTGNTLIFTSDKDYNTTGYNLVKVGEKGDTGKFTPEVLADMKASANRLIESRKQGKDKEGVAYYQEVYKRLLDGEFDSMVGGAKATAPKKTKKQLREEYLENLADETSEVWDKIGASSGGQIREDQKLLKAYADGTEEVMQKMGIKKGSFDRADYDYYTDNNAHLFNDFLVFNGYYNSDMTKSEKEWRLKAFDEDIKQYGKSKYISNPDVITVSVKTSSSSTAPNKKGSSDYTYVPNKDVKELSVVLKGELKKLMGSDILDGVYVKNSAKSTAKVDVNAVFAKILKDAKEAKSGKTKMFTATDLKKLNLEMVQKLVEAGYTEQQIRNIIFGYAFDNEIVADNELEYDKGIFSYEDTYIKSKIEGLVEAQKNKEFAVGIEYPDFDWQGIIKKYKISSKPKDITEKQQGTSGSTENYYEVFVGDNIVIGHNYGYKWLDADGKVLSNYMEEDKKVSDPTKQNAWQKEREQKAGFNGGWWTIISSKIEIIDDVLKTLLAQKGSYCKEIQFYDDSLPKTLKENKIAFADGGELNKDNVKVGDVLVANTGVEVKVVEFDPKFGGRIRAVRLDEYATGKASQFMPLNKFTRKTNSKMADGGFMNNVYDKGGEMQGTDITAELEDFDIDNLDDFETMQYNQFSKSLGKVGALQVLINSVEGDYTQLSPELAELAEMQMSGEEYDEATRQMRFERDGYAKGGKLDSGVYRVGKPTKISSILYEQKIAEIFDNGDISTASDYGRKLSDFKSQKYPIITKEQFDAQYKMANGGGISDYMNSPEYKEMFEKAKKLTLDVKGRVVRAVGLDRAIEFYDADYPVRPFSLIERAVKRGFMTLDEINERVVESAMETAQDSEEDEEVGSSDFTSYLHNFLDEAGFKVGYVNSRLTREYADGGFMNDVYAKGGSLDGVEKSEIRTFVNSLFNQAKNKISNDKGLSLFVISNTVNATKDSLGNPSFYLGVKKVKNSNPTYVVGSGFLSSDMLVYESYKKDSRFLETESIVEAKKFLTEKVQKLILHLKSRNVLADGGMFDDNDGFMKADNNNNYRYPESNVHVDTLDEPIDLTSNVTLRSNRVVINPINENIDLTDDNKVRARMGYNPKDRTPEKMMMVNQRMVITDLPKPTSNTHKND